jgi:hypothetical protein
MGQLPEMFTETACTVLQGGARVGVMFTGITCDAAMKKVLQSCGVWMAS